MSGLKQLICLTLLTLPFSGNTVLAAELSPSTKVQDNIQILKETNSCPKCDLSGANLNRLELSGANLSGANLSRAQMALANLSHANLSDADLREAVFSGADLAQTDMRGADLTGASFVGAYMVGSLLDGEMVTTTPYASEEISDVEEMVYVEDTVNSKAPQETEEMSIASRRDFEETPPAVPVESIEEETAVEDVTLAYDETENKSLPSQSTDAPAAKAVPAIQEVRIQEDVVSVSVADEIATTPVDETVLADATMAHDEVPAEEHLPIEKESIQEERMPSTEEVAAIPASAESTSLEQEKPVAIETIEETVQVDKEQSEDTNQVAEQSSVEPEGIETEVAEAVATEEGSSSDEIVENAQEEMITPEESTGVVDSMLNMFSSKDKEPSTEVMRNLAMLLDIKQCYGCDLSGVDLSGENLEYADLETANLSNANLKGADLEGANLKGADLSGADLSEADLENADLYTADLTDANLSDANLENALLDETNLTGVTGYSTQTMLFPGAN